MAKSLITVVERVVQRVQKSYPRRVFLLGLALFWGVTVEAFDTSKAEYELLPIYCRNQAHVAPEYFNPDAKEKWRSRLGEQNYAHIHHYCWGLVQLTRAYKAGQTEAQRKHQFRGVVADITFSLERSTPDFVLLPEMYTRIGEAYLGLGDDRNAEVTFKKAWEANPSYWPAYVWWSQRLLMQGKRREALTVAEEGNKNAPGSKALEKLVEEIRGAGRASQK